MANYRPDYQYVAAQMRRYTPQTQQTQQTQAMLPIQQIPQYSPCTCGYNQMSQMQSYNSNASMALTWKPVYQLSTNYRTENPQSERSYKGWGQMPSLPMPDIIIPPVLPHMIIDGEPHPLVGPPEILMADFKYQSQ